MKKTLFLASIIVLGAAATLGLATRAGDTKENASVTSEFEITGMTCGGCAVGVKMTVRKLDGVEKVEASYEKSNAVVTYDPAKVTAQQIEEAIEELGYQAELKKPKAPETSSTAVGASGTASACC